MLTHTSKTVFFNIWAVGKGNTTPTPTLSPSANISDGHSTGYKNGNQTQHNQQHYNTKPTNKKKGHIVIPSPKGLGEENMQQIWYSNLFQREQNNKGHIGSTLGQGHHSTKSGVIYWFRCSRLDCDEEHTKELSRTFGERYKEPLKAPSPIYEHQSHTIHYTTLQEVSIVGRGAQLCKISQGIH